MSAIPTMIMIKDDEEIIINAPDYDKFVEAGYTTKKAKVEKPAAESKVATPPTGAADTNANKS